MLAVLAGFNTTTFSDQARVHALALNMVGSMAAITNGTFLQQVYELGPSYSPSSVSAYARSVIANGTLATYPVTIPDQLTTNFVSSNNKTMLFLVTFTVASDYTTASGEKPLVDDVQVLRNMLSTLRSDSGTTIVTYVTGDAGMSADMQNSMSKDLLLIEPFTIVIIIVLMGILFRSVLGQFLPLGVVGVALGISEALVFVIGSTVAEIDSTTLLMMLSILIGVGTDYSVFIIMRYREERIKGAAREQAVHASVTWAGESIVTSGRYGHHRLLRHGHLLVRHAAHHGPGHRGLHRRRAAGRIDPGPGHPDADR